MSDPPTIRPFRAADAPALTAIYRRAVAETGARFYTPAQVAAWLTLAPAPEDLLARMAGGRVRLVAVDAADRPLAFADLEAGGHLDLLYAAPEATGRGLARRLHGEIEAIARRRGASRLFAEASEAALPFFRRAGYRVGRRRDLVIAGVAIHNHAVDKPLA